MSVSLAQGKYCDANQLDPEDPRCAHVILTGRMQKVHSYKRFKYKVAGSVRISTMLKVKPGSEEEAFAKQALFKRHPIMPDWPKGT